MVFYPVCGITGLLGKSLIGMKMESRILLGELKMSAHKGFSPSSPVSCQQGPKFNPEIKGLVKS